SSQLAGFGMSSALLAGQICSSEPLEYLDPQVEEFITLPGGVFRGVFVRGGVSFPIIQTGCPLSLSAGVDAGAWALGAGFSLGGLVSGSATGKVLCMGGLRGQVTAFGELSGPGPSFRFGGEAFGVAGVGLDCDPQTWTSVQRSREDKWCATGDASTSVILDDQGWSRQGLDLSGPH
ncbi:MAG: hypothetical protein KDK91_33640, partial [Gammaproteobacteria bacterium]|nr:hypothetical protein [Gammaproteobacteria bacterium]